MITIKQISRYPGEHLDAPMVYDSYNTADGKNVQFETVEEAFIFAEHHLYAYNVFVDDVVVVPIDDRLKTEQKINY